LLLRCFLSIKGVYFYEAARGVLILGVRLDGVDFSDFLVDDFLEFLGLKTYASGSSSCSLGIYSFSFC
jgi:hypothetical protein